MSIWADVCNTSGQCVRQIYHGFTSATSDTIQPWTLTWEIATLPVGTYSGTIWVGLTIENEIANYETITVQSDPVNFTISSTIRTFPIMAIKNQPFTINVGAISNYDFGSLSLPATNNSIIANNTAGQLTLSSAGLVASTIATFGNTAFAFHLQEQAAGVIQLTF
jgi:hypothetical protein